MVVLTGSFCMDSATSHDFSIKRTQVARYFYYSQILIIILVGIWFVGIGLVVALVHAFTLGRWLPKRQSQALLYRLDNYTLMVNKGVFFLKRKSIPLDRVTDIVLAQGPLMKACGIWELRIQTAGTGQSMPEASLYGLDDPEGVRDLLLKARDEIVQQRV